MRIRIIALVAMSLGLACGKAKPSDQSGEQPALTAQPGPAVQVTAQAEQQRAAEATRAQVEADKQKVEEAAKQLAATAPAAGGKPTVEVHISTSGMAMKFDVTTIAASSGQPVHLVLENKPPGLLPHNWALVRPGTEAKVAAAGLTKGLAAGYLEPSPDVLAHTEMIMPGKTAEVTFAAPAEPGKYPYICTFPGHYMMMKGVLDVTQ